VLHCVLSITDTVSDSVVIGVPRSVEYGTQAAVVLGTFLPRYDLIGGETHASFSGNWHCISQVPRQKLVPLRQRPSDRAPKAHRPSRTQAERRPICTGMPANNEGETPTTNRETSQKRVSAPGCNVGRANPAAVAPFLPSSPHLEETTGQPMRARGAAKALARGRLVQLRVHASHVRRCTMM
jgi:hypothetical protein